jgi:hypothetical protein
MNTLVCIAPDGSLELWSQHVLNNLVYDSYWQIDREIILDSLFGINMKRAIFNSSVWGEVTPDFWGREVLGEL